MVFVNKNRSLHCLQNLYVIFFAAYFDLLVDRNKKLKVSFQNHSSLFIVWGSSLPSKRNWLWCYIVQQININQSEGDVCFITIALVN